MSDLTSPTGWTAIILAGQRPGIDPLANHFGEQWKALVKVEGEPMLRHVVRTVQAVDAITRIVVVAQQGDVMRDAIADLTAKPVEVHEGLGGISQSVLHLIDGPAQAHYPLLVTTADHVLLTPDMIRQFLGDVGDADVAVAMVEEQVMLAQFPDARRTWLRFRDGAWSGANLFALAAPPARKALELWQQAEVDRKKPWRLFRHFGLGLAIRAITRTIGLNDALGVAGKRLGLSARLVPMVDPVAAIDVDKPFDHAQAEAILAARRSQ